jgi:hypothetical protein
VPLCAASLKGASLGRDIAPLSSGIRLSQSSDLFSGEQPGWSERVSTAPRHVGFGSVFD